MTTKVSLADLRLSLTEVVGLLLMVWQLSVGVGFLSAGEAKPSWQSEWERIVEAAKREGQVTIYGSNAPQLIVDSGVFQNAYPEIKVVTVMGGGGPVAIQRLLTERRAGRYLADLVIGGSTTPMLLYHGKALDPIKPALILPEVIEESRWWRGKHLYNDQKRVHF